MVDGELFWGDDRLEDAVSWRGCTVEYFIPLALLARVKARICWKSVSGTACLIG